MACNGANASIKNLMPGDFVFGNSELKLKTLLGSCVAITLWHPDKKIGGMCHYMLPGRNLVRVDRLDGRYANEAMLLFLQNIYKFGTDPREYHAQLFGGSNVIVGLGDNCATKRVFIDKLCSGCKNIACHNLYVARTAMKKYQFNVVAGDFGGTAGRKVEFDIATGRVESVKIPTLKQ